MSHETNHDSAVRPIEAFEGEEGRVITGQKKIFAPSQAEYEDHMRTHIPFRRWCPFCVRGKCKSAAYFTSRRTGRTAANRRRWLLDSLQKDESENKNNNE